MASLTPVRLMHGVSQHLLRMDPPDRTAFQTAQAANMTTNGMVFKPNRRHQDKIKVPKALYNQDSMIGYKDNGTIDTLLGPVKDIQRTLPPAQGVYRQNTNNQHIRMLQGMPNNPLHHKRGANFLAEGDTDVLYAQNERNTLQNATKRSQLENKYNLNGYRPCNTGVREAPFGVRIKGGHFMQRYNPRLPPTNREHVKNQRVFSNNSVDIEAEMLTQQRRKCHDGEVKTNVVGPLDGLLQPTIRNGDAPKGSDQIEVMVNPLRQGDFDAQAMVIDKTVPPAKLYSETSFQHTTVDVNVLKGVTSTNEQSDSLVQTEVKGLRHGRMDLLRRNPLYNNYVRPVNTETKIKDTVTYQSDNHRAMVQNHNLRAYDKSVLNRRIENTQFTDVAGPSMRATSRFRDSSTEVSLTRTNPLYDQRAAGSLLPSKTDHKTLDEVNVVDHPTGLGGEFFPSGRSTMDMHHDSFNC